MGKWPSMKQRLFVWIWFLLACLTKLLFGDLCVNSSSLTLIGEWQKPREQFGFFWSRSLMRKYRVWQSTTSKPLQNPLLLLLSMQFHSVWGLWVASAREFFWLSFFAKVIFPRNYDVRSLAYTWDPFIASCGKRFLHFVVIILIMITVIIITIVCLVTVGTFHCKNVCINKIVIKQALRQQLQEDRGAHCCFQGAPTDFHGQSMFFDQPPEFYANFKFDAFLIVQ